MRRSAIGALLVLLGAYFLLNNLGWMPNLSYHIFSWPVILVLIGVIQVVSGKVKAGLVLIAIGGLFWINRFFNLDLSTYWPLILIVIGVSFILRHSAGSSSNTSAADTIDDVNVLSGGDKKFSSKEFKGGKITTMFGGADIDLTDAKPVEGATIDLFTMFGGTDIKVPNNWQVNLDATALLGGVSDDRKDVTSGGPALRVKGFVMFGGVSIKS